MSRKGVRQGARVDSGRGVACGALSHPISRRGAGTRSITHAPQRTLLNPSLHGRIMYTIFNLVGILAGRAIFSLGPLLHQSRAEALRRGKSRHTHFSYGRPIGRPYHTQISRDMVKNRTTAHNRGAASDALPNPASPRDPVWRNSTLEYFGRPVGRPYQQFSLRLGVSARHGVGKQTTRVLRAPCRTPLRAVLSVSRRLRATWCGETRASLAAPIPQSQPHADE